MTERSADLQFDSLVISAAQWLADRQLIPSQNRITLPEIASRFGLTHGDAAEAILIAGNFSVCRRAFG